VLRYSKQVRDPVLGWIWLTEDEVRFVDGCAFIQRLRYVNQLGLAHLVYPTARHTRFEHSLGVVHLVTKIFQVLLERDVARRIVQDLLDELNMKDQGFSYILQNLRIAALLHDIGHYPFSHSLENYLSYLLVREVESREELREIINIDDEKLVRLREIALSLYVAKEHELITYMLLTYNIDLSKTIREKLPNIDINLVKDILFIKVFNKILKIGAVLESMKNDLQRVRQYDKNTLKALKLLNSSISSTLDADRVDYMLRDLYFTGASVSTNITLGDVERILANMRLIEKSSDEVLIAFNEKARPSLEGFIIARYNLYKWVYLHHKVTLMSTLIRMLYSLLIRKLEELAQLDLVRQHIRDLAYFACGTISSRDVLKLTDYSLFTLLSTYYEDICKVLGEAGKKIIDSVLLRVSYYRPVWKRDVEFENSLKNATGETALQFNQRIGALIYEICKNPEVLEELLSIFYKRLITELKISLEIYGVDEDTFRTVEKLCRSIEEGNRTTVIIGFAYFEPDIDIYIVSREDGTPIELKNISPLTSSVRDAWERSPKIFIYIDTSEISNNNKIMKILQTCTIKALDAAIKDLVNIHSNASPCIHQTLQ